MVVLQCLYGLGGGDGPLGKASAFYWVTTQQARPQERAWLLPEGSRRLLFCACLWNAPPANASASPSRLAADGDGRKGEQPAGPSASQQLEF